MKTRPKWTKNQRTKKKNDKSISIKQSSFKILAYLVHVLPTKSNCRLTKIVKLSPCSIAGFPIWKKKDVTE